MNSHSHTDQAMGADHSRQISRHVKASLLHLVTASGIAREAGVDMVDSPTNTLFRIAMNAVDDLDDWAIGNADLAQTGLDAYAGFDRWCHTAGGVLPTGAAASGPVTGERMRGIESLADELAKVIDAAYADFRALARGPQPMTVDEITTDDLIGRAGFRLPVAASQARHVARAMRETGQVLERIAAVPADACRISWPVCPEHGNTVSATGGTSWCRARDCGRRWDYDRGDIPCPEPVRWRVTDSGGHGGLMCDGHALAARAALVGGSVTALDGEVAE